MPYPYPYGAVISMCMMLLQISVNCYPWNIFARLGLGITNILSALTTERYS